ncbi:MAG TPA: DUF4349 domain-containing protein [Gemmatimonadaceae bacterium]|nr:DUF4349 domain-containing protein [Gemmatimonadaceae bacterium]
MKSTTMFLTIALALTACEGNSSSKADGSAVGKTGMSDQANILARPGRGPETGMVAGEVMALRADAADASPPQVGQAAPTNATSGDPVQSFTAGTTTTMIIRTGQAFIEVEKVDPAVLKIRQLAAQVGGYITNSSMSGGHDQIRQATLELKIPSPKYNDAVESLSTIGKVETVTSNAQDVGEEFVDVTARVTNSKRLEERLISLLANRTGKLDEVLRVERELARVREEIERYEGRLRYLSTRVAMSTLTITVHEPAPILGNNPGENPIAAALRRAWRNFIGLLAGLIASLGVVIPLALIGVAGWYGYKRWKNKNS